MIPPPFAAETARARDFLRAAAADGASVAPCGRRTRLARHRPRAKPTRWLECTAFCGLVWLDAADQTCEVGVGTSPAALDAEIAPLGLMLAVDAPLANEGTLGGLFLAPDLSLLHAAYGPPRDQVLGGSWMLADGTLVRTGARVVKSVAGYDLTRLFLGSRGLLAAGLTLVLRLQPRPRALHTARVHAALTMRSGGLADPLWCFQEAEGPAWAAWEGFLPSHSSLTPVAESEFHAARLRTLAQFATLPRRFAHARTPQATPPGPMDWNALQEGATRSLAVPPQAVCLPASRAPHWWSALTQACAPDAPAFARDEETA